MNLTPSPPRLALVGDRSSAVRAHEKIPMLLEALATVTEEAIEPYWLHSTAVGEPGELAGFDGIWVIPGSPYEDSAGVLSAVTAARTAAIPFLGTCGGFQYLLIEYARNVCGLTSLAHGEENPEAHELLIVPLECSLVGEEAAVVVELADHPFFLGTLFQPELSSDSTWVHPVISAFVGAVRHHAAQPEAVV